MLNYHYFKSFSLFQLFVIEAFQANGMLLFNEPMTALQALQRGFVSKVFGKEEFSEKTAALVDKYSTLPKHVGLCHLWNFIMSIIRLFSVTSCHARTDSESELAA